MGWDLAQDVRYAARQLRRTPAFTAVAVFTLALGIGVHSTVFDVVDAFAFKPVTEARVDDVYIVSMTTLAADPALPRMLPGRQRYAQLPLADYSAFESARSPLIAASYARLGGSAIFQTTGNADTLIAEAVTAGYADVFRLRAQAGRWFSKDDDMPGAEAVAVISDRIWRAWFGGDRSAIGHARLKLNRQPLTIVGVAPPGFRDATGFADVWLPASSYLLLLPDETRRQMARRSLSAQVIVRARPGTPRAQAAAVIAAAIRQTPFGADPEISVAASPMSDSTRLTGLLTLGMIILAISSLVLMAACANLTNMLYARGIQREAEIAVRVSLGASRVRIGRLFLLEAGIISGLATGLGLALAAGGLWIFSARFPALRIDRYVPITISVAPDRRILTFGLFAGVAAALFVGMTTAWRVTRVRPLRALASAGAASGLTARSSWVRTALVSIQITAAVVLVMIAGAFLENVPAGLNKQLHFDTTHVVAGHLNLKRYGYTEDRGQSFMSRLVDVVRRLPGVDAAAYGDSVPSGVGSDWPTGVTLTPEGRREGEGVEARSLSGAYSAVSPGYLRTLDIPLRRGRDIGAGDVKGAPTVAVISESAAAVLWPGEDPIGKRVLFGVRVWLTVVGVSADPISGASERRQDQDVASYAAKTQVSNYLFVPFAQWRQHEEAVVVLRSAAPSAQVDALRAAVRSLDEDVAVLDVGTVDDAMFAWYGPQRAARVLSTTLGVLALVISMLGVYGVVSYFVSVRTREFGVRLALGSSPGRVLKLVVDYAIHVVLVGLLPAVFVASIGSRLAQRQLALFMHNFMPNDIATWVAVPLIVLASGVAAGIVPGLRAARLNPNQALRES